MNAPEDNPDDDHEMTPKEWNEFEEERQSAEALKHEEDMDAEEGVDDNW